MSSQRQCRHEVSITKPCAECELGVAVAACVRVLVKLSVVSEVPAQRVRSEPDQARKLDPRRRREHQQPQPLVKKASDPERDPVPQGVNQHEAIDGRERAPSKHLSLHAHYQWRMAKAQRERNALDLKVLAVQAERAYVELMEPRKLCRDATDGDAVKRLLTDLCGCSSEEAAEWMAAPGQSQESARLWVRKQRILNGRDPDDGEPREHQEKLARAVQMTKEKKPQKIIGDELGMSQGNVSKMLAGA